MIFPKKIPRKTSTKTLIFLAYIASFLYSFHYALPLYIQSSFLLDFAKSAEIMSVIFAAAAILTIIAAFAFPRILKQFGNYRVIKAVIIAEIFVLIVLSAAKNPMIVIGAFVLYQIFLNIIYLSLNSFVESFSEDKETGGIRGIFLTILNIAIVAAPILAGSLLADHNFEIVYLVSAVFLIPAYILISRNFRSYKDPVYQTPSIAETARKILRSHDLHSIVAIVFLLNFFYAWMIIYMPIYLNTNVGIPMETILTVIIPIALIPFVVFQIVLGKIADKKMGETEILAAGFFIAAASTAVLSLVTENNVALWAGLLFLTRVGASAIEVMAESYLYKKIDAENADIIASMFIVHLGAYIIAPAVGSVILAYFDYRYLFLILGAIMLFGIPYSLSIRDTK